LLGAYNLTSPTVRIDWRNAANIISYTSFENMKKLEKNKDYTEYFSTILKFSRDPKITLYVYQRGSNISIFKDMGS
jgi:hypothetical protein